MYYFTAAANPRSAMGFDSLFIKPGSLTEDQKKIRKTAAQEGPRAERANIRISLPHLQLEFLMPLPAETDLESFYENCQIACLEGNEIRNAQQFAQFVLEASNPQ